MNKLVSQMTEEERLAKNAKQMERHWAQKARIEVDPEFAKEVKAKRHRQSRARYKKNPEKYRKSSSVSAKKRREKAKTDPVLAVILKNQKRDAHVREYAANPGRFVKATQDYRSKNPHKVAEWNANRRAKEKNYSHPEANQERIDFIYQRAATLTKLTGWKHSVDHIIPVSVGGHHHEDNLQALPVEINSSKHNNPFWEHPEYCSWRDVPRKLWPAELVPEYDQLLKAA